MESGISGVVAKHGADAVIGFGSGMTSHALLGSSTLHHVVTIEIEPEMINAARTFLPANRRAFDDPRSSFVIDDARAYYAAMQPPVSHLRPAPVFTRPAGPYPIAPVMKIGKQLLVVDPYPLGFGREDDGT